MQGLEEARKLYERYGVDMIERLFPNWAGRIAAGLVGHGSECFGFDDELSRDHDFPEGFCLWVDDETDRAIGVQLARAYRALPFQKAKERSALSETSRGVRRISDFYSRYTGCAGAPENDMQWLNLPSHALAESTNGAVFRDDQGLFSSIRETLLHGMPEDVRLKKLAGQLLIMGQSGQYNYLRCLAHGETAAAQLAVVEFVQSAMAAVFLLNDVYQPYYKWSFRALRALPKLSITAELSEYLLTTDNEEKTRGEKYEVMEGIAADVIEELQEQGLTRAVCGDLEKHAYSVNDRISDAQVRNMHVLAAV